NCGRHGFDGVDDQHVSETDFCQARRAFARGASGQTHGCERIRIAEADAAERNFWRTHSAGAEVREKQTRLSASAKLAAGRFRPRRTRVNWSVFRLRLALSIP